MGHPKFFHECCQGIYFSINPIDSFNKLSPLRLKANHFVPPLFYLCVMNTTCEQFSGLITSPLDTYISDYRKNRSTRALDKVGPPLAVCKGQWDLSTASGDQGQQGRWETSWVILHDLAPTHISPSRSLVEHVGSMNLAGISEFEFVFLPSWFGTNLWVSSNVINGAVCPSLKAVDGVKRSRPVFFKSFPVTRGKGLRYITPASPGKKVSSLPLNTPN